MTSYKVSKKWFILATLGTLIIWSLWVFLREFLKKLGFDIQYGTLGSWGDSFGGLNALFGALACIAVVATFWMQRQELSSQQNQIDESRKEQHKQGFESSFFQLLGLLRDLRKEVKIPVSGQGPATGPDALKRFHQLFLEEVSPNRLYQSALSKDEVVRRYEKITRMESENELGPYYRIIYSILRRISEDDLLSKADKEKYGNLVRSQLSTSEIGLMGLNGLTKQSNDFQKFIVEFRLLKYLPDGHLREILTEFYPATAFEARD